MIAEKRKLFFSFLFFSFLFFSFLFFSFLFFSFLFFSFLFFSFLNQSLSDACLCIIIMEEIGRPHGSFAMCMLDHSVLTYCTS